ncbi:unnamed protein product, partial [Rotaria magnacalcarata]
ATWRIYRIETKRTNKFGRHTGSVFAVNTSNSENSTSRLRNEQNPSPNFSSNGISVDKTSWRKVENGKDLDTKQRTAIQMIR